MFARDMFDFARYVWLDFRSPREKRQQFHVLYLENIFIMSRNPEKRGFLFPSVCVLNAAKCEKSNT